MLLSQETLEKQASNTVAKQHTKNSGAQRQASWKLLVPFPIVSRNALLRFLAVHFVSIAPDCPGMRESVQASNTVAKQH